MGNVTEKWNATPLAKTPRRWKVVAFLSVMFFCGFTWYSHSFKDLILQGMCHCENNNTTDISPNLRELDSLQDTRLPRMIYATSNALNQTRTDVLTMSPWFAPIVWEGTYSRDILDEQFKMRNVRIGLTVFAIKKYVVFLQHFIETAEKFFMVGHKVNIYIFTDQPDKVPNITLAAGRQIITLQVPAYKRWQDVTMRRMEMLHNASRDIFVHEVDYIVAVDMDEEFLNTVGVEILSDLVGTLHPGFYTKKRHQFTYDRNPNCQAYIPVDEGDFYYAGGFFCGTVNEVYKLTGYCHEAMMIDREHGIEALWHDESHLNKYLLYHKPTKILSPEYLYDNYVGSPVVRMPLRFKAVPKNPSAIRNK